MSQQCHLSFYFWCHYEFPCMFGERKWDNLPKLCSRHGYLPNPKSTIDDVLVPAWTNLAVKLLTTGEYSMGGRSLGDRQDWIIGGFHHGGALAFREPRKSQRSFSYLHQKDTWRKIQSGETIKHSDSSGIPTWIMFVRPKLAKLHTTC